MPMFIDSEKCTGCGICVPICPEQAISIIQKKAVIDNKKCTECMECMEECPTNAIYQILDKEVSVTKREASFPESTAHTESLPKQTFWTDKRKQQALDLGEMFLSGIKKIANNFFRNDSSVAREKGQRRGQGKHRRRHGRGRR